MQHDSRGVSPQKCAAAPSCSCPLNIMAYLDPRSYEVLKKAAFATTHAMHEDLGHRHHEPPLAKDMAEAALAKGRGTEQLEARVRGLEQELGAEQERSGSVARSYRQGERARREAELQVEGLVRKVEELQVRMSLWSSSKFSV